MHSSHYTGLVITYETTPIYWFVYIVGLQFIVDLVLTRVFTPPGDDNVQLGRNM
jgi:hypothetical protein